MEQFSDWLKQYSDLNPEIIWKLAMTVLIVVGLLTLRTLLIGMVYRKLDKEDVKARYRWKRSIKNTYYVLVVTLIGLYWLEHIGSLATFLGLITAGLAIALKDPLVNFVGWAFILMRKPLQLGDRIQIGEYAGDVIDIRFFQFTINEINNWVDADQSTGRIIHIPNGYVFLHPQASYNQGFEYIWNEIHVLITFESNWQLAQSLLEQIEGKHAEQFSFSARKKLIEASKKYMIFYGTLTPIVYLSVKESGVQLSMRYLIDPRKRRTSENNIWKDVLTTFAERKDIDFAYPTQRVFYNPKEGKSGTIRDDQKY